MSRRGWMLFAAMGVIWGIPYLLIKVAVEGVSVPFLVFARCVIGALVLLPLVLRGAGFGALRGHGPAVAAFAVVEIIVPWWLLSDAEIRLTSSMSGLLIAASPILTVLLARVSGGREWLGVRRWTGLVLGFAGVAVLAGPGLTGGDAWSITEVLLTALCYATGPIIADRFLQDVPTLPLTVTCLTGAALVFAVPAALTRPDAWPEPRVTAAVVALGLVCTALAFVFFLALIQEVGSSRALVFTYVNPAVALAAGFVVLDERLTWGIAGAFALILAGSVLATAGTREPEVRAGEAVSPDTVR